METLILKPELGYKKLLQLIGLVLFIPIIVVLLFLIISGVEPILFCFVLAIATVVFTLFWIYINAFYRTLEYTIDNDSVRLKKGVFWRVRTTVPYKMITNIDITQGPIERLYRFSNIRIQTAGSSGGQTAMPAELIMYGIRDYEAIKDMIMNRLDNRGGSVIAPAESTDELSIQKAILAELVAIRKAVEK